MFNKNEKKTQTLKGVDVAFVDTEKIINIAISNPATFIKRVNEFVDAFLRGVSCAHLPEEPFEYHIHGMELKVYNQDKERNERYNVYSPTLNKFCLSLSEKFFTNTDNGTLQLYVTFPGSEKEGLVFNFKFEY